MKLQILMCDEVKIVPVYVAGQWTLCVYLVEGGHRAIIFSRIGGVQPDIYREGLHFRYASLLLSFWHRPIAFLLFACYVPIVVKRGIWEQCNIEDRPTDIRFWQSLPGRTSNVYNSITVQDRCMVIMEVDYRGSNGHVTYDATWPRKVKVVTPLFLRHRISIMVPDRRMHWRIVRQMATSIINHYWQFFLLIS